MSKDSLRRAVWQGTIPVRVMLDPSECRVFDQSDFYYINIPRISYLPIFIPQIYAFYKPYLIDTAISNPESAWFEVENAPLKWHWPVGLLYDFYTAFDPTKDVKETSVNHDRDDPSDPPVLPWTLTLRFRDYPTELLMSLSPPTACHDAFINAVKEADFARNGTAKAVMSLSKSDSSLLYTSLSTSHIESSFTSFWSVTDKLLNATAVRNVPMKIYNPETGQVIQASIPVRQINSARGEAQTLGTALNAVLPGLFPSRRASILARPVCHGVVLPMGAAVGEVGREMMYPDGFLHVTLAMI